jgi:putative cell wall-binding protein
MRIPKISLAAAAILGSGAVGLTAGPARAAGTTLFVRNVSSCSDQTTDSIILPFCTLHGALAVVQPGDTVQIADGDYIESDVISVRGTADAPITITAAPAPGPSVVIESASGDDPNAILDFEHAAYVRLSGLLFDGASTAATVLVNASSHIVLDNNIIGGNAPVDLAITGSDSTSVTRGDFEQPGQDGVLVNGGSTGTVVATSNFKTPRGVRVDGAVDTAVTGNTADDQCIAGVQVLNGSTGTSIENNILGDHSNPTWCPPTGPLSGSLAVSADSAAGTHADYNLLDTKASAGTVYRWGTQTFSQAGDFHTATTQGAHDVVADPMFNREGSPAIDSADSAAIGEQDIDSLGNPRVLDPTVPQTGAGPRSYDDRGAQEFQDRFRVTNLQVVQSGKSFTATLTAFTFGWRPAASYTFDFGDGHPVTQSSPTITHTFQPTAQDGPQRFPVTVTASEADSATTGSGWFNAELTYSPPTPVVATSAPRAADGLSYSLVADASASMAGTEPIASYTFTVTKTGNPQWPFSQTVTQTSPILSLPEMTEGDYSVSVIATDALGMSTAQQTQQSVPMRPAGAVGVHRIFGTDRYQTGVAVSQQMWADAGGDSSGRRTAGAVVLATGTGFADAVAGVPLAAKANGPLLLTAPASLTPETAAEITRILPAHQGKIVYVLGGTGAISPEVENQIKALGYTVTRFGGADRYATALAIAQQEFPEANSAYTATGQNYADALSAGPLAAAVRNAPVLLSDGAALDKAVAGYLRGRTTVTAVGGPAATALGAAGIGHQTLAGTDRYDTAAKVAAAFPQALQVTAVGFATGTNYADALTGGAMMAALGQPLLLTDPGSLSSPDDLALTEWEELKSVSVFGGPGAVSDTVLGQIVQQTRGGLV